MSAPLGHDSGRSVKTNSVQTESNIQDERPQDRLTCDHDEGHDLKSEQQKAVTEAEQLLPPLAVQNEDVNQVLMSIQC